MKEFLKNRKKATKEEANELMTSIAEKLGHKKFVKKEKQWKNSYAVTMNHYVQPKLVRRLKSITVKK